MASSAVHATDPRSILAHDAPGSVGRAATRPEIAYAPALDGVRGACLLAVLLFHSGFTWMRGGFLGVSTFFTLSGFLITTLLVVEHDATGRVALGRFCGRRLRRLLPAGILTVAAVVATAPLWVPAAQRERLAGDAIATLLYVVNWRFVEEEYAYGLIFTDPSPLQHFWSLAIEGQFYLLFPLLVGVTLRLGGTRALGAACVLLALASGVIGFVTDAAENAQHRLYYGTDARAGELLAGALLALACRPGLAAGPRLAALARRAGPVAALLIVLAWCRADVAQAWLYHGGFLLYAALSVAVVAAALEPESVVSRVLAVRWLRALGTVSYGAYLYHWPVFLWLDAERTGLGPLALFALRFAVTVALAALSYRFLELPVRRGVALHGRSFRRAMLATSGAVAVLALVTSPVPLASYVSAVTDVLARRDEPPRGAGSLRIAIFGDSTAFSLWNGLGPWLRNKGGAQPVPGMTKFGCGLFAFGEMQKRGVWAREAEVCHDMTEKWRERLVGSDANVAVILVGPWEVRNRRRGPNTPGLALGDPELDAATRDAIRETVDTLAAAGAAVVWLTSPHIIVYPLRGVLTDSDRAASDPARIDRLNELIHEVARSRRDRMRVVDLAKHMASLPGGEFDETVRLDNVHFSAAGAARVAEWLGPEVLRAARELLR